MISQESLTFQGHSLLGSFFSGGHEGKAPVTMRDQKITEMTHLRWGNRKKGCKDRPGIIFPHHPLHVFQAFVNFVYSKKAIRLSSLLPFQTSNSKSL